MLCVLVMILSPLLGNNYTAGWDTLPHFYLLTKMYGYLQSGHISGYDPNWFAGYPAFIFYGPLPYILISLPTLLTGELISLNYSFNLFLFLLPIAFLAGLYFTSRVWFDKNVARWSLLFGLIFLFSSRFHAHLGMGINSAVYVGLIANFLAIVLLIFMLGVVELQRRNKSWSLLVLAGFLLAGIILTHAMTTIFAGLLLGLFTLMNFKKWWKEGIGILLLSLVLSSFWLIPFLQNLVFSSGESMGISGLVINDPLLGLFPELNNILYNFGPDVVPAILLFFCCLAGVVKLVKTNKSYFAWAFLLTLVFLPRDYLISVLNLPIHYYRFISHLWILNIFVCAYGFEYFYQQFNRGKLSRVLLSVTISGTVAISLFNYLGVGSSHLNATHDTDLTNYPEAEQAQEILKYIGELPLQGRIATHTKQSMQNTVGSPHFFSTFIPLDFNKPVLPGLLAESALSTQYILPTLTKMDNSFNWGKTNLLFDPGFKDQDNLSMIKRLELYGVEYLLSGKNEAQVFLDDELAAKEIEVVKEFEDFTILKFKNFTPLIASTDYKPFLFVDKGGEDFKFFTKEWFKNTDLFEYPVIYTDKDLADLPENEKAGIAGYIFSFPVNSKIELAEYEQYLVEGKKVIFLNVGAGEGSSDEVKFVQNFSLNVGGDQLAEILKKFASKKVNKTEVVGGVVDDREMNFNSAGGTLINYSYFPKWKREKANQIIYWATPSSMWVFGDGEVELEY